MTVSFGLNWMRLIALSVCGSVKVSWGVMLCRVVCFFCPLMILRVSEISSAVTDFKLLSWKM